MPYFVIDRLIKVLCYLQSEKICLQKKHVCKKNYHLHWIAGRANVLSKYIIYIFFNFGHDFCGSFPMLFPKAPAPVGKLILNLFFVHCTSIFMSSKGVSQIFNILFQTADINIFVLDGVFLVDMFN